MSEVNHVKPTLPPVGPGPCPIDRATGLPVCPPPVEIDVIKVKKIFEECMHTQVEEVELEFEVEENNVELLTAQCGTVEVLTQECRLLNSGLVKITATLRVTSTLNGYTESQDFQIEKVFRLNRAGEPGLTPQCHIYPECLQCFISDVDSDEEEEFVTVTCCIGILILIKLEAEVQLLVPTYGYAPEPPECPEVLGECPATYNPEWPPYPPQNRPPFNPGNPGGCKGCK